MIWHAKCIFEIIIQNKSQINNGVIKRVHSIARITHSTLIFVPNIPICPYLALFIQMYHYLPINTLFCHICRSLAWFDHMCHIHHIYVFSYRDCTSVQKFRAVGKLFMDILHFKEYGDTKSVITKALIGCLYSHWYICVCSFGYFITVSNFKAIEQLLMDISHFKELRIQKVSSRTHIAWLSSHMIFLYTSDTTPLYQIWKRSRLLDILVLHFKRLPFNSMLKMLYFFNFWAIIKHSNNINIKNYTAPTSTILWHGALTCKVPMKYVQCYVFEY